MPADRPPTRPLVLGVDDRSIDEAVRLLRRGGIVGVPTETVYGLAAAATDPAAVARVFAAKGRPSDHPLIVHLGTGASLDDWAADVPDEARLLAEAFWPGPLTLVLARHAGVPTIVTGGHETVALRMPGHPIAQRLLGRFGSGLAAPSANRFGRVSPTTAADVMADLGAAVDAVLDGGPCRVGVESTIVEVTRKGVTILRPGGITAPALVRVLGRTVAATSSGPSRAPGMLASHYAPDTPVELHDADGIGPRAARLSGAGKRVGTLSTGPLEAPAAVAWHAGGDVDAFARSLYRWLREADAAGLDVLLVCPPPPEGIGIAVADRLRRAAHR